MKTRVATDRDGGVRDTVATFLLRIDVKRTHDVDCEKFPTHSIRARRRRPGRVPSTRRLPDPTRAAETLHSDRLPPPIVAFAVFAKSRTDGV